MINIIFCLDLGAQIVEEVVRLQTAYYKDFKSTKNLPVYDPVKFEAFCVKAGAPNVFKLFLSCMTSSRHTRNRVNLNRQRCVSLIMQLCFGLSQKCDFFQVDNGILLKFSHCTNEGIDTQRSIGTACCSRSVDRALLHYANSNKQTVDDAINTAIQEKQLLLLMIDDYTTIHTNRRPTNLVTSNANSMATIIVKIFPTLDAIAMKKPELLHPKDGIDVKKLQEIICSDEMMSTLGFTYASCMPELTTAFFDPLIERGRLEAHDYCASPDVQNLRRFENVHLIDFLKLPLKSRENYQFALDVATGSKLKEYCSQFVVLMPGDYPSQFHPRKIIYDLLAEYLTQNKSTDLSPLLSIIPMIGPLHIDLNSDEDLVLNYIPLLKQIYEAVFPGKVLANQPKPWRIQFLLEIVYGGWTLIRRTVKTIFHKCKDIQYGTLLNFLDNYCPLILTSYSVLFKTNKFSSYYNSIIHIWIMMYSFRRHHYNKVLLIWLSFIKFWESNEQTHDIYNTFAHHLNIIDESTVEYVHSVIRRHTTDSATDEQLKDTIKAVFGSSSRQSNFRQIFTPPKNYVFSRVQLKYLHSRVASVLVTIFTRIANSPDESKHLPRQQGQRKDCERYILPALFGETITKSYLLPLGFQCEQRPNVQQRCDLSTCCVLGEEPWHIFEGCWHSFHVKCLAGQMKCNICQKHLKNAVNTLATSANATLLEGKDDPDNLGNPQGSCDRDDDDDENSLVDMVPTQQTNNYELVINELNEKIIQLVPQSPLQTVAVEQSPSTNVKLRKPPHCSLCKHVKLGHSRLNATLSKCSFCPNGLCSATSETVAHTSCSCTWHKSNYSDTNL